MIELSLGNGVTPTAQDADHQLESASKLVSSVQLGYAGDTLNTAIYLKRTAADLGSDASVSFVSAVGCDTFSDQMLLMIESESINTNHIARNSKRLPGIYAISTDEFGERSFSYWRDSSAARLLFQEPFGPALQSLEQYDGIYYSGITLAVLPSQIRTQLLNYLNHFRKNEDKWVAFDSNYRPHLWQSADEARQFTEQAYRNCDIALPSVDDEQNLFEDDSESAVIERLQSYGIKQGALKRGAKGAYNLTLDENTNEHAVTADSGNLIVVESVVDSTAAGDSFNGGYLASWIYDKKQPSALVAGHNCAARVIQHRGAIVPIDTWLAG